MDDEIKTGEMTGEIDESITVEEDFTLLEGKAVSINDDSDNKTKEEEVYEEALDVKESLDDIRQQIKDKLLNILEKGKITDADSCEIELLNDQYNEKYNELKDLANTVIPGGKGTSIKNASTTDNSTTEIVKINIDYDEILNAINEKADWLYIDEDGQVMLNGEVVPKLKVVELEAEKIKADVGEFKELTAENFTATNAEIENLKANKADIEYLTANYATIQNLNATNAEITNLKSDYGEFKNLTAGNFTAINADIDNLTANKADVDYLTSNYATINMLNTNVADINTALIDKANVSDLNATNALVEDLRASKADIADLTAVNAKITNLEAGKADIAVLEANYATIKQLDATNANVTNLQTETANINKALIDKANVADLNATNANVTNLQATKADVSDLNAAKANISTLTSDLAEVTTLVNGNLTSDNIQSMVITGEKFTVADAFIKDAMIDSVNANKINTGVINTNNVKIQSNDGSMILQGNLQQFKDKNGKVRIQIGKDATGNFTFVLYDENGTGQLINQNGIQSSNAIADGLIVDSKVADNANIAGSKLDIDSVVTEVNNGTTSIKGTKIYLDDQKQALNVAFNNMSTTVKGNTNTIQSHTTSINTMNGKVTKLISDTTITQEDGSTVSLKDAYNSTVDTVDSHSTKIGSLETNLATANNNISSVSSKQTALEQNLNGFKATVSDTYTTKADFNGLSVGGTNLLLQTKTFGNKELIAAQPIVSETYRGLTVRGSNSITDTHTVVCEFWVRDFNLGDTFTFSFYAKGNIDYLCSYFYGNLGYVEITKTVNSQGYNKASGDGHNIHRITSEWKRYWVTWTLKSSGDVSIPKRVLLRTDGSKVGQNIYVCGCKLEKGNKATEWIPAPEDIDSDISAVDGKFVNYSTTSQMNSAINQKANEITSTVSETYATKASLTTVDNKFANYSTTSAMNTAIQQKADSILSTVSKTYATQTSVTDVSNNLKNNYSTTSAMNSAINQKGDAILSSVSSNYATKSALSTVDGKFANYSTTTAMNSAINQKADSILSTVSNTYATKTDFNNLSVGGTNLLRNSSTFDDWYRANAGTLQANGYMGHTVFYRKYTATSGGNACQDFIPPNSVTIEPNTQYTLSFWVKGTGKFYSYLYPEATIKAVNCDGATWSSNTPSDGGISNTVTNKDTWRRFWITFTTGNASGSKTLIVVRQADNIGNSELYICAPKFEKGNRATDWSPAPEDIDDSITAVDNKFVNYSTTTQMNSAINQKANEITSTVSETYATKASLTTVDNKFANYSTTSAMNSAINQKANEITSTVSETYATKSALTTVDNKFANYSTTSAMNSAINQKSDAILSTVSNTYATKTALSTVDGKFANYSTTSQMNSAINQKSDSILSTVSSTYTTKTDFNGLTIGGTNLYPNSNFKTQPQYFEQAGGSRVTWDSSVDEGNVTTKYNGKVVQLFDSQGTSSSPKDVYLTFGQTATLQPNTTYTLSFDYYSAGAFVRSSSYIYLWKTKGDVSTRGLIGLGVTNNSKNRTRFVRTFTTDSEHLIFQFRIGFVDTGACWVAVDGVKLEKGNRATEWSPTPGDIDTSIATVDGKFANYSTTSQMNSAINQKANEITSTVSETYATKTSLKATDDKFANYSTTTAMNSAINQKGDSILSTVSNTYATKTTVTDLSNNLKNNYSTTTAMNTAINQKSDAILSTVSSTYTTKSDFNKLSIGGTNLLTGTRNFDDGWFYDGFALQNGQYDGTFKGCYINWTGTSGYKDVGKNNSVYLEPNTEYTLSFWARGNGKFWSYLYTPNKVVVASGYNSSGASTTSPDGAIVNTLTDNDKFKRYWITWKTASNLTPGKYNVIPCRVASNLGNCHMVICGVKIEKGNKATAWTPAPQDVDSAISAVDGKFASYSTTTQMNSAINQKANEITSSVSKTYATKTDLNTANGNISSLTNRMQSAESKLTKDSLTTTIGSYYTTSTNVNDLITAKGYATTSQVSQTATDLTAKFKSTGGINLIRNSTAIGGTNGWQGNIGYTEWDSAGRVTGNRRFFYINNKNTTENYAFSPRFALKANTTYTLSCWIYRNTTSTGYDVFVLSSNSKPWTDTSTSYDNAHHLHAGLATSWERVEKTFTTGANEISGYVRIDNNGYTGSGDANNANIHFASLMLTEGTIAHPWTPHPSECYSGITQIDGQGIKVYHKNIDGENYTHMASSGFYIKNKGVDIFKVDANGLYVKGNGDFTGKVTANDGSIGGFTISSGKLVGTGGNGVGMSGNGTDWAFWAGSNTGGNAPFHVGHEGNLYATQAYITGTITASTITGSTINGTTINSDSFIGDMLAIDGTISAKSLQVQDIDNAKYPATLDGNLELYVNSSSGNDDNEPDDGVRYKTLQGAIDAIPKFLNGKTVYITMETDSTEDVYMRGFVGGAIRMYMNGKTLYGTLRSYVCAASINVYGGTKSNTEGATGTIHPNIGLSFGTRAVSVGFEASQYAALYKIKVYAPDNIPSDVSNTDKVCVASQAGTGSVYCKNIQIVNAVIGFRTNNHGSMHVNSSSGVASKYGFQAATGGIISLANNNQAGGKTANTNKNSGGQVWYDSNGPKFATGNQTTDGGTAPVAPTTKTLTIKSSYGDTYRSTVYNSWKRDGSVRGGDYGYGDCNGCWFFGSAFSEVKGKTISKVEITITRNSGGKSSAVGLVVKSHGHSGRPSGAPTYRTTAGTLSLATGATGKLTITNSTILNEIKSGTVKGFGIQNTYDSNNYAVCSGSCTVKITYTE